MNLGGGMDFIKTWFGLDRPFGHGVVLPWEKKGDERHGFWYIEPGLRKILGWK